jgi:hypothetical protein
MNVKKSYLALLISMSAVSTSFANSSNYEFPHFITSGEGVVHAVPDQAEIKMTAKYIAKNPEQAKIKVDLAVNKFMNDAKNIDETISIESANIRINPIYSYPDKGERVLESYESVRNVLLKTSDLEKLNGIISVGVNSGMNGLSSMVLKVSDEDKYREEARQLAFKSALNKAKTISDNFGFSGYKAYRVEYQSNSPKYQTVNLKTNFAMSSEAKPNSYSNSTITFRDNVEVVYQADGTTYLDKKYF